MDTLTLLQPDNRGRVALNAVIDRTRTYSVTTNDQGVVTLTPVGAVLSDEQLGDLRTDPAGFVALLDASDRYHNGTGRTVSIDDAFADLD